MPARKGNRLKIRNPGRERAGTFMSLWLTLVWCGSATAQVNIDAYRDYFLVGQFGEVCTMCAIRTEMARFCTADVIASKHFGCLP